MKKFLRFFVVGAMFSLLAGPVFADQGSGPSGGDPPPPPTNNSSSSTNSSTTAVQLILTLLGSLGL